MFDNQSRCVDADDPPARSPDTFDPIGPYYKHLMAEVGKYMESLCDAQCPKCGQKYIKRSNSDVCPTCVKIRIQHKRNAIERAKQR